MSFDWGNGARPTDYGRGGSIDVQQVFNDPGFITAVMEAVKSVPTMLGSFPYSSIDRRAIRDLDKYSGLIAQVVYTADGTFVKSDYPTMTRIRVRAIGGGGAGGAAQATTAAIRAAGGGGGAGAYSESIIEVDDLAETETVTIGAGGVGSTAGAGPSGGDTSFGSHVIADGASGGDGGVATGTTAGVLGGTGGLSANGVGSIRCQGATGHMGLSSGAADNISRSGAGAPGAFGGGARGVGGNNVGKNAVGYGAGGSGACNNESQSARAGGDGEDGVVIVDVYGLAED